MSRDQVVLIVAQNWGRGFFHDDNTNDDNNMYMTP